MPSKSRDDQKSTNSPTVSPWSAGSGSRATCSPCTHSDQPSRRSSMISRHGQYWPMSRQKRICPSATSVSRSPGGIYNPSSPCYDVGDPLCADPGQERGTLPTDFCQCQSRMKIYRVESVHRTRRRKTPHRLRQGEFRCDSGCVSSAVCHLCWRWYGTRVVVAESKSDASRQ